MLEAQENKKQLKIAIFLPSLEHGGAERRMVLFAIALQKKGYQVEVIVLRAQGAFVQTISEAGIVIRNIDKQGRYDVLQAALKARKFFKTQTYHVVFSCLPSANVFSIMSKLVRFKTPLIWGLAAADMPMHEYSLWARLGAGVQKIASRCANKIIVNSNKGFLVALNQGFSERKMQVIHNGVDIEHFVLNKQLGNAWRSQLNIPVNSKVIGVVARLDPAKGLKTFIQAAEMAYETGWYFIIFASGSSTYASKLKAEIQAHTLFGKRLFLMENIKVDSSVYNAFDLLSISSVSESFPNVMLEAMSCGVPVVATDVGDCKKVLQQFGKIVPVGNPAEMFKAWQGQLHNELNLVGADVMREYIMSEYSIQRMTDQFEQVIANVLGLNLGMDLDLKNDEL